ncbi:hypothetical protein Bca4012_058662 [Brassica carinata]|uniref:Transcription factor CBF/NF-Y/archaeal histone domain-containing protein n=1 Tax=Brassica carinata TaxID=52824 RepID=A0A8X7W3I1_BRACI|nr:hypothetical protein Bca52824_016357 [Brassica carinata]
MQADEDVGKIAMAVPLLVSKALELFLQDLCNHTYDVFLSRGAKTVNSVHLQTFDRSFDDNFGPGYWRSVGWRTPVADSSTVDSLPFVFHASLAIKGLTGVGTFTDRSPSCTSKLVDQELI